MSFFLGLLAGGLLGAYWTRPGGWLGGWHGYYPAYWYPGWYGAYAPYSLYYYQPRPFAPYPYYSAYPAYYYPSYGPNPYWRW